MQFSAISQLLLALILWTAAAPLASASAAASQQTARYLHKQGTKTLKEMVQFELDTAL